SLVRLLVSFSGLSVVFFFNDPATTEIYTLSLHDALPIYVAQVFGGIKNAGLLDFVAAWYVKAARMMQGTAIRCAFVSTNSITQGDRKSTRLNSSHVKISYAVFCLKKKKKNNKKRHKHNKN